MSVASSVFGTCDHVADAFTALQYLVALTYANHKFVISVKNTEARNEIEARKLAVSRSRRAYPHLGDLISVTCHRDSEKERSALGISNEEPAHEYLPNWRNAA
jgi:hypothetical protein